MLRGIWKPGGESCRGGASRPWGQLGSVRVYEERVNVERVVVWVVIGGKRTNVRISEERRLVSVKWHG